MSRLYFTDKVSISLEKNMQLKDIIESAKVYNEKVDQEMIQLAFDFAREAHKGQFRKNGEEVITHLLGTAYYLTKMRMDDAAIIAGLLHEIPDETEAQLEDVRKNFGDEVATLVEGVARLSKLKYRGMEKYAENLRKMFVGISHDIRIVIIKFADRIHNLETLEALPEDKQQRIAREVMEIYAPIANRLGIWYAKTELEERAFKYVHPDQYLFLQETTEPLLGKKDSYLRDIKAKVEQYLKEADITAVRIDSRIKSLLSIYRKMNEKKHSTVDGLYDLVAMRIIVQNIADCYAVLGIIHHYWKPLPDRIKDYIAQPKPNNYRSLHTTVFCDEGEIVEFQIRTQEMEYESSFGIAAHWNYDEAGKNSQKIGKNMEWLAQIVALPHTLDTNEYLTSLKLDFFQNRIFVFTPKGDVINLPDGSTPVDFAYHIHSDIGKMCAGARLNGIFSSLDTELKSGDVVEIILEKNRKKPSIDWLSFVKTSLAKTHIKVQLREKS